MTYFFLFFGLWWQTRCTFMIIVLISDTYRIEYDIIWELYWIGAVFLLVLISCYWQVRVRCSAFVWTFYIELHFLYIFFFFKKPKPPVALKKMLLILCHFFFFFSIQKLLCADIPMLRWEFNLFRNSRFKNISVGLKSLESFKYIFT